MRALTTITAILLVGSALSSCDQPKIRAKSDEQAAQLAATTPHCNCPQTAAAGGTGEAAHAKKDVSDAQENPSGNERSASETDNTAEHVVESAPPMHASHMWPAHHEFYRHYREYAESEPAPYPVAPRTYYRDTYRAPRHVYSAPAPTGGLERYDQYIARTTPHQQSYNAQYAYDHSSSNASYSGAMEPAPRPSHDADYYNGLMLQYLDKSNHGYSAPRQTHAYQQSSSMNQQYAPPMQSHSMAAYGRDDTSSQQSIDRREGYGIVVHQGTGPSARYSAHASTGSVDAYNYMSSSSVSYSSGYGGGYGQGGANGITWVDGYGRGYFAGQRPTVSKTMRGVRLDPYNGYGVDCPDQD